MKKRDTVNTHPISQETKRILPTKGTSNVFRLVRTTVSMTKSRRGTEPVLRLEAQGSDLRFPVSRVSAKTKGLTPVLHFVLSHGVPSQTRLVERVSRVLSPTTFRSCKRREVGHFEMVLKFYNEVTSYVKKEIPCMYEKKKKFSFSVHFSSIEKRIPKQEEPSLTRTKEGFSGGEVPPTVTHHGAVQSDGTDHPSESPTRPWENGKTR